MKTKITLLLLAIFMFVGNSYSQIDTDPDNLGGPVLIGKVLPFTLPVDQTNNQLNSNAKVAKTVNSKLSAIPILEWPNPGAVHIEKTAESTSHSERWKINILTQGKNIPIPTDVVLVIDNSGSMSKNKITSAKEAATTFTNELLNGSSGIRVAIVTINAPGHAGTPYVNQGFTNNTTTLNTAISSITASGGTNIQGGFYAARQLIATSTATKKVVILLSDGAPTYSYQSTVTTNLVPDCGTINNFNISRNDFEASHIFVNSSNYANIVGNGSAFDYTLYALTKSCNGGNKTFIAGNNGIPTKYEAALVMNSGVDVYTIGFEVPVGGDEQDVLSGSQNKGYFPATSSNIASIYSQIRSNIAYAATNAIFTDPMSTNIVLKAGVTPSYSVSPSTTGNVVVSKGTVTFVNNGYVLNDPDNPASGNSNLIKWKIIWNIGTISEIGDQMYYNVDLAPNTDPTLLYDANEKTYMDYTDVNGNTIAHQETPTDFTIPKVSGGKGSIEIIYYAVNESGQPINSAGTVVPKENALKLIPGSSIYFEFNGSTALEVDQDYIVSPESFYTSNNISYQLYCSFGTISVTPTKKVPNVVVWFGYKVNVAPTTTLVQPTCSQATGSITVTAPLPSSGISYTVTGTNPVLPAVTNTTGFFAGLTPGNYSVTSKSATGCISTSCIVTINAQPLTPAVPTSAATLQPTCTVATGTITVTAPTGTGMTYSIDGSSYTNTSGIFTAVPAGTYSVTAKSAAGCISSPSSITINAQPATPIAPTCAGDQTVCEASPIQTLTASATGGTISWYTAATGGTLVANPTLNSVGTVTYYAQASNGTCASLTRTAVKLTINAAPLAPISGGDQRVCEASPIQTLTAAATGGTITWYTAATGGTLVANPTLNSVGTITYYAQASNGTCASLTRTAVKLTINAAPIAKINSKVDVSCIGKATGSATASAIGGTPDYTYSWNTIPVQNTATATGLIAGNYIVTVTDSQGCTDTKSVTILDGDGTAPTFTRPADITIYTITSCSYDATIAVTGDVTDEADNVSTGLQATFSDSNSIGTCEGSRIITRTWSLVDNCGNKAADQVQTITVSDNLPPTWTTTASALNATIECSNTEALATAQSQFPVAADNCDADVSNISKTTGLFVANEGCANSGSYTNTWTVTDACGNTSAVFTQIITVEDKTAPVIAVPPSRLAINCPETPVFGEATATDNCGNVSSFTFADVTTPGACAGSYSVIRTWTAIDACGNTSTAYQTIRSKDITAPVITTCSPIQTVGANASCQALVPDFTKNIIATDSCTAFESLLITQSPAAGTIASSGTTTIIITVKDACGNQSTCETKLIITNFIVANDDAGNSVNGYTGGISFTNVLSNDLLDCKTVKPEDVTTSFVSSTNPGITLNGTNVIVAAGTPAGDYTLVYSICDKLNPTNCDPATVTITVTAPAILAQDDTIAGGNGTIGNTNAGNVLNNNGNGNDTLNGVNVVIGQVNLTVTTPAISIGGAPVPVIDTATGQVSVPTGTPAGIYTIVYSICDILNPTNCDSGTVTITVTAPAIIAQDDTIAGGNGTIGNTNAGNVLNNNGNGNDTLNGVNVVIGQVNFTVPTPATSIGGAPVPVIDIATGQISVPSGTPAGIYTIVYSICDKLNPTNCDPATVTITVTAPAIIAQDDTIAGGNGTIGNTNAGNVLNNNGNGNDTLNGVNVVIGQVNLTVTTPAISIGGAPVPVIDIATGQISVPSGTPAGIYAIVYSICDKLNPTNCDPATVTITVTSPAIVAQDDTIAGGNGTIGNTNAGNVLNNNGNGNDTLNGVNVVIG
ncbi:MAG: VWA domain-containing protein, partial [Flavobacterium sp.]|nr:VWA domain-containing protein [Flavobacterium sp.]